MSELLKVFVEAAKERGYKVEDLNEFEIVLGAALEGGEPIVEGGGTWVDWLDELLDSMGWQRD